MDIKEKQELISSLINEGERDEAIEWLLTWSSEDSFKVVNATILEPMLIKWGKLWMQGKLSLAHGYLSGKVAEGFYTHAANDKEFASQKAKSKGVVVLGNIEDDFHPLGRRLVGIYAKSAGWTIIDLGNDVPAELFVEKAIQHKADIIAVSAMMFTTAKNIAKVRTELDKQELSGKIKLAVGGAVFKLRPELVADIGGDGTADNAMETPALFDRLIKQL